MTGFAANFLLHSGITAGLSVFFPFPRELHLRQREYWECEFLCSPLPLMTYSTHVHTYPVIIRLLLCSWLELRRALLMLRPLSGLSAFAPCSCDQPRVVAVTAKRSTDCIHSQSGTKGRWPRSALRSGVLLTESTTPGEGNMSLGGLQ